MSKKRSSQIGRSARAAQSVDVNDLLADGRVLHSQGRVNEAFARYQAALIAAPDHAEALHLLGVAYLSMGHARLGIAFVRRAIERSPDVADYRVNLATAVAQQGLIEEAVTQMEAACALRPDDAEALAGLATLQARLTRFADAERSYEAAIDRAPNHAEWHEALARLRYRRWAMQEAIESAQRAMSLSSAVAQRLNIGFALPHAPEPVPSPASLLNASPSLSPAELTRACIERDLLVVDDFLDDPVGFRAEALGLCKHEAQHLAQTNFPGVQTPPQPCGTTMQRIANALGRPVKWESPDHGALRLSIVSDDARADVHVDSPTLLHIFGGVLYLSLPEHCRGGTSFYRHRATGWDSRRDDGVLRANGYASFLEFQKRNLPPNRCLPFTEWRHKRDATWEWMFEVPMRFNRLVIFRSDYFHAITELFGDCADNGRLVQLFHFESQSVG
jgi:tetratricopeptide (TPR) repeat protein